MRIGCAIAAAAGLAGLAGCGDAPTSCPGGGQSAYFPAGAWFEADVSCRARASDSDAIVRALRGAGGWGNGDRFQIDFAIDVLTADAATPKLAFTPNADWYDPDCDADHVPVPAGGNLEGETGYACVHGGDCHLLVDDRAEHRLYEMWRANLVGGVLHGGCLAVWDEGRVYGPRGRGDQCTSADAAGFPITPLLFTADEVAAGHIDHAIRFTLPNDRVRRGYTRPATHGTDTTGAGALPYYGVHLRLRADYPVDDLPSNGARVVARALQTYGMYHADGGDIALTAESDRHSRAKWAGLLDARDLVALRVEDFEVIDHGAMIPLTLQCVREP
jgi:hypothetical protein